MKILYISALSSPDVIDSLHKQTGRNPGFAMQKFNRLIALGFVENHAEVSTLSAIPAQTHETRIFFRRASEQFKGVKYNYIPFVNLPILRHLSLFIYVVFYVLVWGLKERKEKRIVFDVLNISVCLGGIFASKLAGLKSCGIMTDMPGLMVGAPKSTFGKITSSVNKRYLSKFDYYVFLTEAMNEIVNVHHRPYIVMEGLVDSEELKVSGTEATAQKERTICYAGGLYEKYGIKMLVDAFLRLEDKNIQLSLFGTGDMVAYIKEQANKDERIKYLGVAPNSKLIEIEKASLLLINPRPTHEEFVKYSFPSKNMEYMVSGTPLVTTKLPGMPKEYNCYVYLFEDETVDGYYKTLRNVLSKPESELAAFGERARKFVLTKKNNIAQTQRILKLLASV